MILPGGASGCPMEEPLGRRECAESPYNGFMVAVNVLAVWRDLAQPRKPALPASQLALAMGNRLTVRVHLVLELENLRHLVGLGDVLLEQPAQSTLIKCGHSDAERPGSLARRQWPPEYKQIAPAVSSGARFSSGIWTAHLCE